MTSALNLKDARIEFKTSIEIKNLLQEGANALGMDLSNFLISTAVERAKKIQKEERVLMLSRQEWDNFQKIITTPSKPTSELKELMTLEGFDS